MEIGTLILGAGAAGLFCAAHAGGDTLVVDHASRAGEKIRISGGGRCNFTNRDLTNDAFFGQNRHFHKSALARYTQWDFIDLISRSGIAWHEKTLGQLFCDGKATQIVSLLVGMAEAAGAEVRLGTEVVEIAHDGTAFRAVLTRDGKRTTVTARNLVVATGGKSIPKMGATGLAYRIAGDFGHDVTETRPALVPFTFSDNRFAPLAGVAQPVTARAAQGPAFEEAMLFTHRGLSGPAMLQVSSYWREGEDLSVALLPFARTTDLLRRARVDMPRKNLTTALGTALPSRLVDHLSAEMDLTGNCAEWSDARIDALARDLSDWTLRPTGTEGYRTAEVTAGGIATTAISSRTMMSERVQGLYFIGECLDVTGWLGGYNFQWAWSSAHAAGTAIRGG